MKKKIIIGVLIAALIAGGTAGGAVYYRKSHQSEVSVVSVDSLASQYYTDDTSLEGNIATSAVQSITIDKDMIVQDVYVSKGDTVKKGDKLVSFDTGADGTQDRETEAGTAGTKSGKGTETTCESSEWRSC